MPSIQPQQSTTSIASFWVIDVRPELTLWILTQTSSALSWFLRSHAEKPAASLNSRSFAGSTLTGAIGSLAVVESHDHCRVGNEDRIAAALSGNFEPTFDGL